MAKQIRKRSCEMIENENDKARNYRGKQLIKIYMYN